jgi:hypothetical protein
MDLTLNISSPGEHIRKTRNSFIVLIVLSLIIGTFLRISLLLIYPIITLFILAFYRFKITPSFVLLLGIVAASFLLSLFENIFIKYKLLSLSYMLPFLLLLFCNPAVEKNEKVNHLSIYITCLTAVALINDVMGLIQVIIYPYSDDSFVGIYSQYSLSINGLMLLNTILFFYYFMSFVAHRKLWYLAPSAFFLCCSILGYYGAGLAIFMMAFVFAFFKFKLAAMLRTVSVGLASLALVYLFMYFVKPLVLEYNIANIKKLAVFDPERGARKVKSFYNYGISYPRNARDFLLGSGPGTFNSRSAFMVGSPSYFQILPSIKDDRQPYYFKNYAYTLWNANNTKKELYLDGFRNQPFSSVLAFLGEYGLIFTFVFIWLYYRYYKRVASLYKSMKDDEVTVNFRFFKFLIILLPLLLLIDNYYEYPEIMLLVILAIKFAHARIEQLKLSHA